MKIDFTKTINDLEDRPMKESESTELTLKTVACNALTAVFSDEQNLSGLEKSKRGLLAIRIFSNPSNVDLDSEEVTLVKSVIGKGYSSLVVARAWEIMESLTNKK